VITRAKDDTNFIFHTCYLSSNSSATKWYFSIYTFPKNILKSFFKKGFEACVTKENLNGVCKPFNQCLEARQNYLQGIYPTFCSDYISICCSSQGETKPDFKFGNPQRISVQSI
jgi:hypothetical protein